MYVNLCTHICIIPISQYLWLGASNLVWKQSREREGEREERRERGILNGPLSAENNTLKKFLWIALKRKSELWTEWLKQSKCSWLVKTIFDKMTVVLPYPEERAEVFCMAIRGKHFSRILKCSQQLFQWIQLV